MPAFIDTIQSLQNEFKNDSSNTVLVLDIANTSKKYDVNYFKQKYPNSKIIAFNQEPLLATQHNFMHKKFYKFLKEADEIWDYDEYNVNVIKTINKNTKLHILKPYKNWDKYKPVKKDIDILFYGWVNEHREKLLNKLKEKYNVVILTNTFGDNLDSYILRSKILLNIHYYYECAAQEQARMIRWIGAPCRIISEKSTKNYLNVEELSYEDLFNL